MNSSMTRPWTVTLGCALSLGISGWDIATAVSVEELIAPPGFVTSLLLVSMFPIIFAVAAFLRRNWGRLLLAAMAALEILSIPLFAAWGEEAAGSIDMENMLYTSAAAAVVVLMFLPESNDWYRRPRAESA
jgi:hypothetical protein